MEKTDSNYFKDKTRNIIHFKNNSNKDFSFHYSTFPENNEFIINNDKITIEFIKKNRWTLQRIKNSIFIFIKHIYLYFPFNIITYFLLLITTFFFIKLYSLVKVDISNYTHIHIHFIDNLARIYLIGFIFFSWLYISFLFLWNFFITNKIITESKITLPDTFLYTIKNLIKKLKIDIEFILTAIINFLIIGIPAFLIIKWLLSIPHYQSSHFTTKLISIIITVFTIVFISNIIDYFIVKYYNFWNNEIKNLDEFHDKISDIEYELEKDTTQIPKTFIDFIILAILLTICGLVVKYKILNTISNSFYKVEIISLYILISNIFLIIYFYFYYLYLVYKLKIKELKSKI